MKIQLYINKIKITESEHIKKKSILYIKINLYIKIGPRNRLTVYQSTNFVIWKVRGFKFKRHKEYKFNERIYIFPQPRMKL